MNILELAELIASSSDEFEKNNSNLKKKYFLKNIYVFNKISNMINFSQGTFGTGYPFYVLGENFQGNLPIIEEQIRYNNELIEHSRGVEDKDWICAGCLKENYDRLPDLKQICKPCPNIDNSLKPRKIINRLPDLDMWMISDDGKNNEVTRELSKLLELFNIYTSDVDPVKAINDFIEISRDIHNGNMPRKFLPIDTHVIEISSLKILLRQIPGVMMYAKRNNTKPYLPILPISYRKKWQYDDEAYNFVFDFLYSFRLFSSNRELNELVNDVRSKISNYYSEDELVKIIYNISPDSTKRRMQAPEIRRNLKQKFANWRNLKPERQEEICDYMNR